MLEFGPLRQRWRLFVIVCLLAVHAAPALATPADGSPVTRENVIDTGGRSLRYTSHAGRMPIRIAGTDKPRAHIFYVAYRVAPKPG
jgi:carboxypeptidase C (cathepsin A)